MEGITEEVVCRVAEAGDIPKAGWPTLRVRLTNAVGLYFQAKNSKKRLQTKRDKLAVWRDVEDAARALGDRLKSPWIRAGMVAHERAAEATVQRDVDGVESLIRRIGGIIAHLNERPENTDERIARTGAAKPELRALDSVIVSFWEQTKGPVSYGKGSAFVEYFQAFDEAVRNIGEPLSEDTIRSRVKAAKSWLSDTPSP